MRTYSDPHNPNMQSCGSYDPYKQVVVPNPGKSVGNTFQTTGYVNIRPYIPEIDYAKLVDELLKRIRQDASYRYELPGYPKHQNYDYGYQHLQDEANKTKPYWYPYSAVSQANNENQNISYSKGNGQVDTAHSEWMM